jgi:hypothetical protein
VYHAAAPAGGTAPAPARLGVSGAWRQAFGSASDCARDPALRAYMADMLRPYGLDLAEDRLTDGQSYGEMAAELLVRELADEDPVDLLVFAFAVPDVAPWRATASYLSHRCPGQPFAFAVCDQGVVAPFTALRLIRDYVRTGGCRRALLVVAEQAALPYQRTGTASGAAPAVVPASHAVVALLFDQGARPPQSVSGHLERVRLHAGVTRPQAGRLVADTAASTAADPPRMLTSVVGAGLAGADLAAGLPGRVVVAPPEQPGTGVWWELAAGLPGPGPVLLADYDPGLGHLGLAVIETSSEPR